MQKVISGPNRSVMVEKWGAGHTVAHFEHIGLATCDFFGMLLLSSLACRKKAHQLYVIVVRHHLNHPSRDLPACAKHRYLYHSLTHAALGIVCGSDGPRRRPRPRRAQAHHNADRKQAHCARLQKAGQRESRHGNSSSGKLAHRASTFELISVGASWL